MNVIDELAREGDVYVAAIERGDPSAPVPSCPEWALRDLVHHTSAIHRWATRVVRERASAPPAEDLEAIAGGWPDDQDLAPWFRAGHSLLVDALRSAPENLECWSFMKAPSPLAFWSRRQLHETTIHRVDAELASGTVSPIPLEVAVDGIDELLTGFLPRRSTELRPESESTIAVHPTDSDAGWLVTAGPDGASTERSPADGDVVVQAPAADLYLFVWNRRHLDGIDVRGDASLLDRWRSSVTVRWT
jgi:uncharacterized protein (TIGR03083 family)